jgi:hypothetical protein
MFDVDGQLKSMFYCIKFRFYLGYKLDAHTYGYWKEMCGELYLFGKKLVSIAEKSFGYKN